MLFAALLLVIIGCALYLGALFKLWRKKRFALLLALAISPLLAFKAFQFHWYTQAIPAQIGIAYPISASEEFGLRGGCGIAVYKLDHASLAAIKAKGLAFFEGSTQGRAYTNPADRDYAYYTYGTWRKTPIPDSWFNEGSWFRCSLISDQLEQEIISAAKNGGAYYTSKAEGQLLVIPDLAYIVFSSNS